MKFSKLLRKFKLTKDFPHWASGLYTPTSQPIDPGIYNWVSGKIRLQVFNQLQGVRAGVGRGIKRHIHVPIATDP